MKEIKITEEEQERLQKLLYGLAEDISNQTSWGSWEGELGTLKERNNVGY